MGTFQDFITVVFLTFLENFSLLAIYASVNVYFTGLFLYHALYILLIIQYIIVNMSLECFEAYIEMLLYSLFCNPGNLIMITNKDDIIPYVYRQKNTPSTISLFIIGAVRVWYHSS